MTVMTPLAAAIDQASGSFSGELVQPDDAGYDVWRRVHNGLVELQELKGKGDPDNLFRQNVNIVPRWDGGS